MNSFTKDAQAWLDRRFSLHGKRPYRPHSTNVDFGQGRPGFLSNLGMTHKIASTLARMEFASVLDVGASDGFNAAFVQKFFNTFVVASDLSSEALRRARASYGLASVGLDSHQLPFRANSFDVVLCNETIEHVHEPVKLMLELFRVARRFVIISTLEYEYRSFWRAPQVRQLNPSFIHAHRTVFTHTDFERLFPGCELVPQLQDVAGTSPFELDDRGMTLDAAKEMVIAMSGCTTFGYRKYGVLALLKKHDAQLAPVATRTQPEIADALFEAIPTPTVNAQQVDAELVKRLACPSCVATPHELLWASDSVQCSACYRTYVMDGTIPLLHPQQSRELDTLSTIQFADLYPEIDHRQALLLMNELTNLRRTSRRREAQLLRYATSGLNLVCHPGAFTRHQWRKSKSFLARQIGAFQ